LQVAWGADHRIVLDFPLLINCAPQPPGPSWEHATMAVNDSDSTERSPRSPAHAVLLRICRHLRGSFSDDCLWRIHWEGEPNTGDVGTH
jgi:hypothetical protein